jgi:hypothetical protein
MEEKVIPTAEELEAALEDAQKRLQEVVQIANVYIKAHRDFLTQIRTAHETATNLEVLLAEKLK